MEFICDLVESLVEIFRECYEADWITEKHSG